MKTECEAPLRWVTAGGGAGGNSISDPPSRRDMAPWAMPWWVSLPGGPAGRRSPQRRGRRAAAAVLGVAVVREEGGELPSLSPGAAQGVLQELVLHQGKPGVSPSSSPQPHLHSSPAADENRFIIAA